MNAWKTRGLILKDLDRRDSAILKGLAISAIALHNYFHLVSPVRESEFFFRPSGFSAFLAGAIHPSFALQAFFSFFGHFGVQIFVFLSAYGLAESHWDDTSSWANFLWGRIKKLYPKFGLVIIPWCVVGCVQVGPVSFIRDFGLELSLMGLGVSTIVGFGLPPDRAMVVHSFYCSVLCYLATDAEADSEIWMEGIDLSGNPMSSHNLCC